MRVDIKRKGRFGRGEVIKMKCKNIWLLAN